MLTGTWRDAGEGFAYFGAFQLKIHPIPTRMQGKWIGFSAGREIKCDDWKWTKVI
jgi:hypothetical protein